MQAKIKALDRWRVFLAPLLFLAIMLLGTGCGTTSLNNYRASLQNPSAAGVNTRDWKIQHDLFSGNTQQGKEGWEDD
ncbi:MAG: hypothetical protein M0P73_18435 [Syntrophobacterales bacterium]|jgi:hypothetical protein|nr:hypothetical protein [Syntrophobacterales bacterium]